MKVLLKEARAILKIKRSKFIANLKRVDSIDEAKKFISEMSKNFKDATHNCWAYRVLELGKLVEHYSDAGEPPGSAGLPILNALRRFDLVNVAVVVTRYFGGVKLGIKGLRSAYHDVVLKALQDAEISEAKVLKIYKNLVGYPKLGSFLSGIERSNGKILKMNHLPEGVEIVYAIEREGDGEFIGEGIFEAE